MHLRALFSAVAVAVLVVVGPGASDAGTIVSPSIYRFLDHGDGKQGPDYGLRLDSLGKLFSVEMGGAEVLLGWDGGDTASIMGTLFDPDSGQLWDVEYEVSGITSDAEGFDATAGSGFLTDPDDPGNPIPMTGKQNGSGIAFTFRADGHRLEPEDSMVPVGRGWLLPDGSIDDWLVRGEFVVPEPTTVLLLAMGLTVIAFRRRR